MDMAIHTNHAVAARPGALQRLAGLGRGLINGLNEYLAPVLDLGIRLLVGGVFFQSGLVKIQSWSTTLALFENEYSVPLLPPEVAAYLGAGAELILPVFLVLGLGGRFAAFALFLFNIVAALSYPDLSEVGLRDHQYWGLFLLVTLLHGPGKLSVDHLIRRRFFS
jgi:putative oxidoreductase